MLARLMREKKILAQANKRAKKLLLYNVDKACLVGKEVDAIVLELNYPIADALIRFSTYYIVY